MPSPAHFSRAVNRLLAGGTEIRHGEGGSVLAAGVLFFLLLASSMILRPVREALGLDRGIDTVRRLFLVTLAATLVLAPLFGWLVSRVPRRALLTLSFRLCALIFVLFFAGLSLGPPSLCDKVKEIYYVYHSVFNLFVVSLFWAFMADLFTLAESKRLFPPIAIGGTLGAIFGSLISSQLAERAGIGALFLSAAVLLELSVWVTRVEARARVRAVGGTGSAQTTGPIGGHPLAGITGIFRSRYILAIAVFIGLVGVVSTFLYFTGLRLVEAARDTTQERTTMFAHINIWIQAATLLAQALVTGRIMRLAGVATALALLPVVATCGFAALVVAPTLFVYTIVSAMLRATEVGITRPARETLFTVLPREQKYKAKAFIDTFGYRAGDAAGAQLELLLASLGPAVMAVALTVFPITAAWILLSVLLGRAQSRLAGRTREGL